MDELLTLGCIALFFALVVVPILAIIALSRSTAVRSELATLRRRVEGADLRHLAGVARGHGVSGVLRRDVQLHLRR